MSVNVLHIVPGYKCNYTCDHCGNDSGPTADLKLSENEISLLKGEIVKHAPGMLLFTGGEPTLHIDIINELIEVHPSLDSAKIQITTNGWYAQSETKIESILSQFRKLDSVQISYDVFHGSKLTREGIESLIRYCDSKSIEHNLSVCLTEPMDLLEIKDSIQNLNTNISYQKVQASGRAKKSENFYRNPNFDPSVLETKCPNLEQISYICGRGFSTCCSNLMFNTTVPGMHHMTISDHLNSDFFNTLNTNTFKQLIERKKAEDIVLNQYNSLPCNLCESIHTGKHTDFEV